MCAGGPGQQAQNGEADQEPLWHRTVAQPEGDPQRIALRRWEIFKVVEYRRA